MRALRGSGWRQALTSLAMQTGRHAAPSGNRAVPASARRDGNGHRRRRRGEQPMVPDAEFTSYYGRPVIKEPVWQAPDVAGYLFFGGLAGASSVLAAAAHCRPHALAPARRGFRMAQHADPSASPGR